MNERVALLELSCASSSVANAIRTRTPRKRCRAATTLRSAGSEPTPRNADDRKPKPLKRPPTTAERRSGGQAQARLRDREARAVIRQLLDELIAEYAADGRGIEIREIAGGYRMATKPECHDAVRAFVKSLKPPLKLSLPALETLAVIAYKQPVTAPEVNEIRGVDSSAVFGSLLARKLITTAGRKQVIGRPILYKTTQGVPAALWAEGRYRAALDGRVREDGGQRVGRARELAGGEAAQTDSRGVLIRDKAGNGRDGERRARGRAAPAPRRGLRKSRISECRLQDRGVRARLAKNPMCVAL